MFLITEKTALKKFETVDEIEHYFPSFVIDFLRDKGVQHQISTKVNICSWREHYPEGVHLYEIM